MSDLRARMIQQYGGRDQYPEGYDLLNEHPAHEDEDEDEDDEEDCEFTDTMLLLQEPIDFNNPGMFFERARDIRERLRNRRARIEEEEYARLTRIRELGFRLEAHDLPGACRAMFSFVMEQSEEEDEEDEEYEDEGRNGYQGDYQNEGEGDADAMEVEEGEEALERPGRRQKPRKPRRPYSVTCALRKTNWFESSLEWEDEHFRAIYRLVNGFSSNSKRTRLTNLVPL
jgi:hypothetical protein